MIDSLQSGTESLSLPHFVYSVSLQFGVSNPGSGVDDRWNPSGGGERFFCQLSPLWIHADAAGWNVCTTLPLQLPHHTRLIRSDQIRLDQIRLG